MKPGFLGCYDPSCSTTLGSNRLGSYFIYDLIYMFTYLYIHMSYIYICVCVRYSILWCVYPCLTWDVELLGIFNVTWSDPLRPIGGD